MRGALVAVAAKLTPHRGGCLLKQVFETPRFSQISNSANLLHMRPSPLLSFVRAHMVVGLLLLVSACASEPDTPEARVYFSSPESGQGISGPVLVSMMAEGIEIAPAGTMKENSGHFHVLIDVPFVAAGSVIPSDSAHVHFGDGSSSRELDIAEGEHTLRLQFADGAHIALKGLQHEIQVVVQD
ncbi:MAG: hypothetical protein ACI80V_002444 [Rhodothermales bacterium]